jgi:hypothetical protein
VTPLRSLGVVCALVTVGAALALPSLTAPVPNGYGPRRDHELNHMIATFWRY